MFYQFSERLFWSSQHNEYKEILKDIEAGEKKIIKSNEDKKMEKFLLDYYDEILDIEKTANFSSKSNES